jgi:photosystem II stability/assembly factor-like uncharacterized protein
MIVLRSGLHKDCVRLSLALMWLLALSNHANAQSPWQVVRLTTPTGGQVISNLTDVSFWSASRGVVVGTDKYVYYTADSGKTWTAKPTPSLFNAICHVDSLHGIAATSDFNELGIAATIWSTSDGGRTWALKGTDGHTFTVFRGIGFWDTLQGCIVGNWHYYVGHWGLTSHYTADGGNSWSSADLSSLGTNAYYGMSSLSIVGQLTAYAFYDNDGYQLLRTTDAGRSWIPRGSGKFSRRVGANFVNQTTGTLIDNGTRIFRSEDGGLTWHEQTNPGSIDLTSVCFGTSGFGVAVGANGAIISTQDGGAHWQVESSPTSANLTKVFVSPDGNVVAIGNSGAIIRRHFNVDPWLAPNGTIPLLAQNFPNPFNATTTIRYELPRASTVSLKIFNVLGQLVETLVNESKGSGSFRVQWNASVPSGVYFCRMQAGTFTGTKKLLLLK